MIKNKKSFTLIEMITTLAVMGTIMSVFYSTFFMNWAYFDNQLTRNNLWQEANDIITQISLDGTVARSFNISNGGRTVTFTFVGGGTVVYAIVNNGIFQRTQNAGTSVISTNMDFANSSFVVNSRALEVNLRLARDEVFGQNVVVETSTRIFPRNDRG